MMIKYTAPQHGKALAKTRRQPSGEEGQAERGH
jgi:hypothetical protein